ncbi:DUF1573 domain-containing protein [Pedobacter faecalis]|uniref:DUF1573 domain-containing protein n=1 Tax=Pedobacter faecalis TaxID=3041495 RepID=UPI00254A2336|nr:DUF1573 domain-containing protein [Pedobacter sp. ELA7]
MNRLAFLYLLLSTTLLASCRKDRIIFSDGTLPEIFEEAARKKKKIFILVTDGECGSCKAFMSFVNSNRQASESIVSEYLTFKADLSTPAGREIAQILKTPAYPYPYFFSYDGTLLAFGFPNNPDFDISPLHNIKNDPYRFKELFGLPISPDKYKDLISLSVKAALDIDKGKMLSGYKHILKSLEIAHYPFNIKTYGTLSSMLNFEQSAVVKYMPSGSDRILYGNLKRYLGKDSVVIHDSLRSRHINAMDYPKEINLGKIGRGKHYGFSFDLQNLSSDTLKVYKINPACDCTKIQLDSIVKIAPHEKVNFAGTVRPYASGSLKTVIFVHTSASNKPVITLPITAYVN